MPRGWGAMVALALMAGGQPAVAQSTVPEAVTARINELVAQCARAGGQLGAMTGQGRFVIPADFNGDGRLDFLVSEGNVPCTGRSDLFRPQGLARVQLWLAGGPGEDARLAFDDRLLAYRVVDGRPARLQIARRAPACGGPARCGDELRWNAAANRFDEHATDGRQVAVRPATGAIAPAVVSAAPAGAAPAPVAGASAGIPQVQPGAEGRMKARCRQQTLAEQGAQAARWVDRHCADLWARATAAQPLADALLAALAAGAGPVAGLRTALPMVRWASRADQGEVASGRIGAYQAGLEGTPVRADRFFVVWRATGAEIPVDMAAALEARGATLTRTFCEKQGPGEGERAWQVAFPGRAPFELFVSERTAPTGGALSFWRAEAHLDGRPARRGANRCEPFW